MNKYLIPFLSIFLLTCESPERVWNNPNDSKGTLDPSEWAPTNLVILRLSSNEVSLSWEYARDNIGGFKIDRRINENDWIVEYALVEKEIRQWTDTDAIASDSIIYEYRMYAYAGSNTSAYNTSIINENAPQSVNVTSVTYTTENMIVVWGKYPDEDFVSYELLTSGSQNGLYTVLETLSDVNTTSYSLSEFNPLIENWFKVRVTNDYGLSTIGNGMANAIHTGIIPCVLNPIVYENNSFIISWTQNNENLFSSYKLYESNSNYMNGQTEIFSTDDITETSYTVTGISEYQIRYYQLIVEDHWGAESESNIEVGYAAYASVGFFARTFGGSDKENGHSVQQTSDGGYIIVGATISYAVSEGTSDIYIIKTNFEGLQEWHKTFGGIHQDVGHSIQQTFDGGYVILGYTDSFSSDGYHDVWLIKTDSQGNEEWNQTFGGSHHDWGYDVQQTTDGGYVILGYTDSYSSDGSYDVLLIKTDSNGSETWTKTFGGENYNYSVKVQQTSDGGYVITGYTHSSGSGDFDVLFIKTDSQGNEEWNRTFGGSNSDLGHDVQQTSDGGYIITGTTLSYGQGQSGWPDIWLIKTDSQGNEEWNRTAGGSNSESGHSIQQTFDGGYIITGYTESYGTIDIWLIKTDSQGHEEWNQAYGGGGSDYGFSVQQTADDGYIITGHTNSFGSGDFDVWLIKTNSEGNTVSYGN